MKLKFHFELQLVAGTYVAVATGKGSENFHGVIKLNESGAKIFSFLQDGLSEQQTLESMLKIYGSEHQEDIQSDIQRIISLLHKNNLVTE